MTVDRPAISVVMRAHDPANMDALRRAIGSILSQTFTGGIEIVLETSNFGHLPDLELPDGMLRHQDSIFSGDSRTYLLRRGVRRARGRFLMFLDSDDILYPDALSRLHGAIVASAANIVIGNIDVTDDPAAKRVFPYHAQPPTLPSILVQNSVPIHSYMLRTTVAQTAVEKVPNLTMYEDYAFLLHVLSQGRPEFIAPFDPIALYFIQPDMSRKYASVQAFSDTVIERVKASLTFPLIAADLRPTAPDVLATVVAALPQGNASVQGGIETLRAAAGAVIVEGWCTTAGPIFARDAAGQIHHIAHRAARADVDAALGRSTGLCGFSAKLATTAVAEVFIVAGNQRLPLRLMGNT